MRSSFVRISLTSLLALLPLTACEYEWKDAPPRSATEEEVDIDETEDAVEEKKEEQKQSDARPVLAPGKPYEGSTTLPADAKRLEILNLAATNQATIETNVPNMDPANLFDGADDSLVRTPGINPLDTTVTFTNPTKIRAIRIRSTYSDYAVAVQLDGGERLILDPVPEGDWALMIWPNSVTVKKVFVQTLRKVRDNFVHVNEIEVYQ